MSRKQQHWAPRGTPPSWHHSQGPAGRGHPVTGATQLGGLTPPEMAGCSGDPDHTRASPDTKPGESLSPCLMRGGTTGTAEGWCLQVAPPPLRPCGGLAGPCPTQSQCLAAAAGTRPQGPLSANETLCSGRAPGPPHGGHTGEGLAELCTPLAIGHTRPESQRPQWDPAVVGQAEPQAKSTRHQPRQNRPGGKRKNGCCH